MSLQEISARKHNLKCIFIVVSCHLSCHLCQYKHHINCDFNASHFIEGCCAEISANKLLAVHLGPPIAEDKSCFPASVFAIKKAVTCYLLLWNTLSDLFKELPPVLGEITLAVTSDVLSGKLCQLVITEEDHKMVVFITTRSLPWLAASLPVRQAQPSVLIDYSNHLDWAGMNLK